MIHSRRSSRVNSVNSPLHAWPRRSLQLADEDRWLWYTTAPRTYLMHDVYRTHVPWGYTRGIDSVTSLHLASRERLSTAGCRKCPLADSRWESQTRAIIGHSLGDGRSNEVSLRRFFVQLYTRAICAVYILTIMTRSDLSSKHADSSRRSSAVRPNPLSLCNISYLNEENRLWQE